jgi:signal peptidase II
VTEAEAPVRKMSWPAVGVVVAILTLIADQISKYLIIAELQVPGNYIDLLPIFQFNLQYNTGVSFSMFSSDAVATRIALVALTLAITGVMTWWMWRVHRLWLQTALGLIIGGALGNIIDRARIGAVTDFLLFHWQDWYFPFFNLADTAITIGAVMYLLDALFLGHHDAPAHKDPTA